MKAFNWNDQILSHYDYNIMLSTSRHDRYSVMFGQPRHGSAHVSDLWPACLSLFGTIKTLMKRRMGSESTISHSHLGRHCRMCDVV